MDRPTPGQRIFADTWDMAYDDAFLLSLARWHGPTSSLASTTMSCCPGQRVLASSAGGRRRIDSNGLTQPTNVPTFGEYIDRTEEAASDGTHRAYTSSAVCARSWARS